MSSPKGSRICFELEQGSDGVRLNVVVPPLSPDDEPAPMPLNSNWQFLSPLTLRVVRLLASKGWLTREEIARELNEPPEGKITVLLPDLVDRGVIESSPRKGYQIAMPSDADPERYRTSLLAWLDRLSLASNGPG